MPFVPDAKEEPAGRFVADAPPPPPVPRGEAPPGYRWPGAGEIPGRGPQGEIAVEAPPAPPTPQDQEEARRRKMLFPLPQLYGGLEALTTLATGATSGFLGGALNFLNKPTEESFMRGMRLGTYPPQTELGKQYADTGGTALATHGPALTGIAGPELSVLGRNMSNAGRAAVETPGVLSPVPTVTAEMTRLGRVAEKNGIRLMPHQLAGGRVAEKAGELAENVPLSGSNKADRMEAFSTAVHKQINPEAKGPLTQQAYGEAMDRAGSKIGDVANKANVKLSGQMQNELNALWKDAARSGEGDSPRVITNKIEDLVKLADDNGAIPGKSLREFWSETDRMWRSTQNGDLKNRLGKLHDIVLDSVERGSTKEDFTALQQARKEYAIGKQIEPVVAKMVDDHFPPAALMARVTSSGTAKEYMAKGMGGEIGDLAKIGQIIKEPASSGTAERGLVYGALKDTANTAKMAGAYLPSLAYNKVGPALSRAMIGKEPGAPVVAPPELTTGLGFEPQNFTSGRGPEAPAWTTSGGAPAREPGLDASGLYPAIGEPPLVPQRGMGLLPPDQYPGSRQPGLNFTAEPALADLLPDWQIGGAPPLEPAGMAPQGLVPALGEPPVSTGSRKARLNVPAVPGRPDLPDVMPVGPPKEMAATEADAAAFQTPGAQLAMQRELPKPASPEARLAEIERLKSGAGPEVQKILAQEERRVNAAIQQKATVADLEGALSRTRDPQLQAALRGRLEALRKEGTPAANNASGESSASQEAINRAGREKAAGQVRVRSSGGTLTKLIGPDAVDANAKGRDIILQRGIGKNPWTVLSKGPDVKQSDIARAIAEAQKREWE